MKINIRYIYLTLILGVLGIIPTLGAPSVKARLDSTSVLMGNLTTLHLEVTQDKGKSGGFPIFAGRNENGYVGVCGDSIELRTDYKRDTVEIGSGKIRIDYHVPVQSFDSGFYQLPQFVYICGSDSAKSNTVSLKVIPVAVTADANISDFAPPADPEGGSVLDYLPDWLVNYWYIVVILILLVAIIIYGYKRYKDKGFILPHKPAPLPYDVAINELRRLKAMNLWEQGMDKEYFTRLTDILRVYLDRRFSINAIEMTTPEILEKLSENNTIKDKKEYIQSILDTADFVKFAKVRPLPEDNMAAFDKARKFVEETKPSEEEIAAYRSQLEAVENVSKANKTKGKHGIDKSSAIKLSKKPSKIKKKGGER